MNYINNAGLVILHPYLPRLFEMLTLTVDGHFINEEAQVKALFLIQYAVFGKDEFPEHAMSLNKLLVDVAVDTVIPKWIEITEEEREAVDGMLIAVTQNWDKLKNTSIDTLRASFLIRDGKLEEQDDLYQLLVELGSHDILLQTLPWGISHIKYSWMKKRIDVKWI